MAHLVLISNSGVETIFEINKGILTIGRHSSNDISIEDESVSRFHAEIEHRGREFFVRDLDSRNGVCLNEDLVLEEKLKEGDQIYLGKTNFIFYLDEEPLGRKTKQKTEQLFDEPMRPRENDTDISAIIKERIHKKDLIEDMKEFNNINEDEITKGKHPCFELVEYLNNLEYIAESGNIILNNCLASEDYENIPFVAETSNMSLQLLREMVMYMFRKLNGTKSKLKKLSINDVLRDMLQAIDAKTESNKVEMSSQFDSGLPKLKIDYFTIYHAIMIIIRKSLAMLEETEEAQLMVSTEMFDDKNISIIIQNNSDGFKNNEADKNVFEPFFIKPNNEETGMSLYIAKKLVLACGGQVEYDFEKNVGCAFVIILPIK